MATLNSTLACVGSNTGECAGFAPVNGTDMFLTLIADGYIPDPNGLTDVWSPATSSLYLFAFTIISSIGYGNFAPVTESGQIFAIVYAMVRSLPTLPSGHV